MARTIAGTLVDPEGTGLDSVNIKFQSIRNNLSGVPIGSVEQFDTDASGNYSQSIEEGIYNVSIVNGAATTNLGKVTVVDGDAIDLMELLNTNYIVDIYGSRGPERVSTDRAPTVSYWRTTGMYTDPYGTLSLTLMGPNGIQWDPT